MTADRGHILAVDIGGSSCKIGRVSQRGDVSDVKQYPTRQIRTGGPETLIEHLNPYIQEHSIKGVSIGIPATVDWEHNHVRSDCEELPWIEDASNKKTLQDELKRPLLLVNDVEALLVGEWLRGELKGLTSGVVLSVGESMGSALLWNGEPQQGRRGSIMEVENVSLDTYGDNAGHYPPGSSAYWLSGSGLKNRIEELGIEADLEELFGSNDEKLNELSNRFRDKMAHLLGIIVMMLDPEKIVLGGGLTGSSEEWLPDVEERMDDFVMEQFQGLPSVTLGQLRNDDVVKGPAAFWDWVNEDE